VIGRPATPEGVTPDEIYQVAVRDFGRGEYERARDALARLVAEFRLTDKYEEECRAMLMRANLELGDHRRGVEAYERLVELNPRRGPKTTEERRQLAAAYQGIGEAERALVLFMGVVGEGFALESEVADTYRGIDQLHEAQAFSERLVRSYPDLNAVVAADYQNALRYLELREPGPEKGELPRLMLPEARESLAAFLSHHAASSFADQADRMAVTVLDRLDRTDEAIAEAGRFLRRYPDSDERDDVLYYLAAAYYENGDYEKVFETGRRILEEKFLPRPGAKEKEKSPFRPHVIYLFARIHHQRGELAEAVDLYRRVAGQFEDARDALAFLTAEALEVPDTSAFAVGEAVRLPVRRKNIDGLDLRIYEVDLMRLIAVNKDLRDASGIDLTGIATENRIEKRFDGGRDFRWHEEEIPLSLTGKGVFLVVARAGDRATSGLVLVSDLDISVQEVGDRVRVYAVDRKTREPVRDVFVKISDGREIRAQGFTDARGVFEGQKGSGPLMVVAEKKGDFALYRR
jgi:tetratricopeptide (TPR) repeat protein